MNNVSQVVIANQPKTVSFPAPSHYFRVLSAPAGAVLLLQFDDGSIAQCIETNFGRSEKPFDSIQITSTVSGTVVIEWSRDGYVIDLNRAVTVGIPNPLPVTGTSAPGAHDANADIPALLGVSMVTDNGDGTSFIDPLQSVDRQSLLVGHVDVQEGFVVSPPSSRNVKTYATARMSVATADAAQDLLLADNFGVPLGYHKADGTFVGTGIVPAGTPANSAFYIPLTAVLLLQLTSAGNGWGLRFAYSPVVYIP